MRRSSACRSCRSGPRLRRMSRELLFSPPCEGRGGLGRGAFWIRSNLGHPFPAPCLRRGRASIRLDERRVGEVCVWTCTLRRLPFPQKQHTHVHLVVTH